MYLFSKQIAFGLHSLLLTNAANIHRKEHWTLFFALLEAAGAAVYPDDKNVSDFFVKGRIFYWEIIVYGFFFGNFKVISNVCQIF